MVPTKVEKRVINGRLSAAEGEGVSIKWRGMSYNGVGVTAKVVMRQSMLPAFGGFGRGLSLKQGCLPLAFPSLCPAFHPCV